MFFFCFSSTTWWFVLHYFIIDVSDWLAGDDSDWLIDWLLVSWTQCLSLTGHTRFLTSIGCLSLSAVCWFDLLIDAGKWALTEAEACKWGTSFFVLIEWRHLILFGKWQQTDKNESIVIVMVQWSLCPHLTSNRVHSLTAFNQCNPGSKVTQHLY